jgi:hypothetical protein
MFNSELRVFPNPSTGIVNIAGKIAPRATIRVTDMMGRIVMERPTGNGDQLLQLDLSSKGKGMYNVEMLSGNQWITNKVMIH